VARTIENWLNSSVSIITGYVPIELLNGEPRPYLFEKSLINRLFKKIY
jgi:hypothetical protein